MVILNPQSVRVGNGKVWVWVWGRRHDRHWHGAVQYGAVQYGAVGGSRSVGEAVYPRWVGAASRELGRREVARIRYRH